MAADPFRLLQLGFKLVVARPDLAFIVESTAPTTYHAASLNDAATIQKLIAACRRTDESCSWSVDRSVWCAGAVYRFTR